jgi:hypothetical protein
MPKVEEMDLMVAEAAEVGFAPDTVMLALYGDAGKTAVIAKVALTAEQASTIADALADAAFNARFPSKGDGS